jgi:hypothetical protein
VPHGVPGNREVQRSFAIVCDKYINWPGGARKVAR